MNFNQFMLKVLNTFPNAQVEQTHGGEIVIYPNLREDENGNVVEIEE